MGEPSGLQGEGSDAKGKVQALVAGAISTEGPDTHMMAQQTKRM